MQLSKEEKQALKEKYKQQRRSMWAGKRTSDTSGESAPEEAADPEVETDIPDRHETDNQDYQDHTVISTISTESESNTSATAQKGAAVEIDDAPRPYESASQSTSQQPMTDDAVSRQLNAVEQIATAVDAAASDTTRLVGKIREQREEMWEEKPSIRSRHQKRQRKVEKAKRKSPLESKQGGERAMLTWKLVLGVIGTIIVLIAIGIVLGIWFANQ